MKKYNYIYKITNHINGKIYIGKHSTNNLNDEYMGSGKLIKSAIQKYGIENFTKEYLAFCDTKDKLNWFERFYIKKYNSRVENGNYNLTPGGDGGNFAGNTLSEDHKRKISESEKGKIISNETRKKMSESKKDKKCPKISEANKGKQHTEETKKKISESHKGKKKPTVGKANKRRRHSDETKRKISESEKGKIVTEETKQKMSDAKKGKPSKLKGRSREKLKWITPTGEEKVMDIAHVNMWHPDWLLIE